MSSADPADDDPRFCGPVGAWIDVAVTVTYLREHKSRYGHSTCLNEVTDHQDRTLCFWDKAPCAELGETGRVRGLVTRHLVEFGRPRTELGQARFKPGDPYAVEAPMDVGAALDAAVRSLGSAASTTPTPPTPTPAPTRRPRTKRSALDLEELPDERRGPPPPSLGARFRHLDLDDE